MSKKIFLTFFFIVLLFETVIANLKGLEVIHYISKPLVVGLLLVYFINKSKHLIGFTRKLIIAALLFSLLGDILLLFVKVSPHFFIAGLIAFLAAHLMYILVFYKKRNISKSLWLFLSSLLMYAVVLFYFLKEGLGELFIPVIIYMIVILGMIISAYQRKNMVSNVSYNLVLLGAFLFMISDSILALNKFHSPLALSNFSIMLTYAFAQFFIVLGLLKQR